MFTTTISSLKGGIGKTSTSIMLGNAFAASGKRVLVVDLDHQMNLTQYHRRTMPAKKHADIGASILHNDIFAGIHPSHVLNTDISVGSFRVLEYRNAAPERFTSLLAQARGHYDICIVDCPPSLDNLVVGAWNAADVILTPVQFDSFNLEGVRYLRECITNETDSGIKRWKTFVNLNKRPKKNDQYTLDLEYNDSFESTLDNLISTRIPRISLVRNAIDRGELITKAKKKVALYNAIIGLAKEISGIDLDPPERCF